MFFSILNQVSTFSILIACVIGMRRYATTLPVYRPFLFFIWVGAANEVVSIVLVSIHKNNIPNSNIYALIEYLLLLLIFYRWSETRVKRLQYAVLLAIGVFAWTMDDLVFYTLNTINSAFRVFYSLLIVLLSINQVNKLVVFEKKNLLTNTMFQVCMAFSFYYSYKAFLETFYLLEMPFTDQFYQQLFTILLFINFFTNIVYAIALLCMPTKREFTLPY